ncbi:hypothetical protein [Flavobacterium terrae]|uniref:Uncharacterized protein n=1 Tax=Flavobacterium terrae TaxID=415425 RepID=A0A1M6G170_9FLAO|nr:hypothetical protein [Flavobacterium terrae]SHJ03669.1 hypothetical protein SAMN05444363_2458 [Flavobacterium terrae]
MNKKHKLTLVIGLLLCITIRLFCGVFEHDEFGDDVYFIKHKPTWKWRFKSPQGKSDLKIDQMTPAQQEEQILFDEFVGNRIRR